jgi:N6-L-threonylcarbamoyladenine synthase
MEEADASQTEIDGIAVTARPGLTGSLVVGTSFGKGLAFTLGVPLVGIDHVRAHLYAIQLEEQVPYPYLGVIVSGGHTMIARVDGYDDVQVLGATIDDACGEAFDKVAKYYDLGYPGGLAIDRLAESGDPRAFNFPDVSLHKGSHRYDLSYSGLKTAVINQLDQFHDPRFEKSRENIAAAFQKCAIDMVVSRLRRAAADTGLSRVVIGGGVAANSYFRRALDELPDLAVFKPSLGLCTDNAAMIAGLGYHYLRDGRTDGWDLNVSARVPGFRKAYP